MTPLSYKLRLLIPLVIFLFGTALGLYSVNHEIKDGHRRMEERAVSHASFVAGTAISLLEQRLPVERALEEARRVITSLSADPSLRVMALADENDRVIISSRHDMAEKLSTDTPFSGYRSQALEVRERMSGMSMLTDGGDTVIAIYPVLLGAEAGKFRPARMGVLYMEYDLSYMKRAATADAWERSYFFGGILFIFSATLWWILHNVITKRVSAMLSAAKAMAGGDLTARTNLKGIFGDDEIIQLANAFDRMAGKIEENTEHLQAQFDQMITIFDSLNAIVSVMDMGGDQIIFLNRYGKTFFTEDEKGEYSREHMGDLCQCDLEKLVKDGTPLPPVTCEFHDPRTNKWFQGISRAIRWPGGKLVRLHIAVDITGRKKSEESLRMADKVIENTLDGVAITDAGGTVIKVNPAFTTITGYPYEEVVGRSMNILKSGRQDAEFYRQMWEAITGDGYWEGDIWNRHKSGRIYPERLTISAIRGEDGGITNFAAVFTDITAQKRHEEEIVQYAYYDALTALPNRVLFTDRLNLAISHAGRSNESLAVMFIDLDRFKAINDTLGHNTGDLLLKAVAEKLRVCVRKDDTVCRQGGDEFIIILPSLGHPGNAKRVALKILNELSVPIKVGDYELFVTGSIGISLFPDHGGDAETLVRNADLAMYKAKEHGKNTFRVYDADMNVRVFERMTLETAIRKGLEHGEFRLVYQPQVEVLTGNIIGLEALLRWHNPEIGIVSPSQFIPVAEETGLILPIGDWVMKTACRQWAEWKKAGLPPVRVAINLSAGQFRQKDLLKSITNILDETGMEGRHLELELTESTIMYNINYAASLLNKIKELGIEISIDDFGTGYSSISYLKHFPFDKLKIAQSFINDVTSNPDDALIVEAIIAMGKSLEMRIIAEGVETMGQKELLEGLKCDEIQGYLYSQPLPPEDIARLLKAGRIEPSC